MHCLKPQMIWSEADRRRWGVPARPVLWSLLLHGLVISILLIGGGTRFQYASTGDSLSVHLLSANGPANLDSVAPGLNFRNPTDENVAVNQPSLADAWASKTERASDLMVGGEEVYLSQEFLSSAATPVDDIDLQDIYSPNEGAFQMYLWIDSRGSVTRVDVEDSDVASWLVDQVVERFKKSRFTPGVRGDKYVAAIMHVEVVF